MRPTLSICIPTLNRPKLLMQSLNSIFGESSLLNQLEICISNNCSEADYSCVVALLNDHLTLSNIKYIRHPKRLSLDENHHYVKRMATSEYIYFLGDDDFFLRDELSKLLELIENKAPDLAIFNGYKVNEDNFYLGLTSSLATCEYDSIDAAFTYLRDKGTFGAVLVRQSMLQDSDFELLYQTDHAYGCFWLSLFRKYDRGESLKIIVPDFPCVAIRFGQKTYNRIEVYYNKIPRWMAVHQKLLEANGSRYLFDKFAADMARRNVLLHSLINHKLMGDDLNMISKFFPDFYNRHRIRIWLAKQPLTLFFYKKLRKLYRGSVRKLHGDQSNINSTHVEYKLSSAMKI